MGTLVTTQILVHLADMLWQVAARDPAAALCALQQKAVACVTFFFLILASRVNYQIHSINSTCSQHGLLQPIFLGSYKLMLVIALHDETWRCQARWKCPPTSMRYLCRSPERVSYELSVWVCFAFVSALNEETWSCLLEIQSLLYVLHLSLMCCLQCHAIWQLQHIEAETTWPPFHRWHIQMLFFLNENIQKMSLKFAP